MTEASGRIKSVDIFRGLTIALMILVNNPGNWDTAFAPLRHAPWNGLTPTDCVFPFFLFIMGVSMYLSLRKSGFRLSWRVLRRTLLLFAVGLTLNYIGGVVFGGDWAASHLRIMGVLQRFALCYGITAVIVATVDQKWLRWIAAGLLVGYSALLLAGNGYCYGTDNILSRVDFAVFGENHLYSDGGIEPEGLLSTIPAIAHTIIGFLVGKMLVEGDLRKMDMAGWAMVMGGFFLMYALPINKKVWSPTFVLVTTGAATLILSLIHYLADEKGIWKRTGFFMTFGSNAIFCYVLSDIVAWTFIGTGLQRTVMGLLPEGPVSSLLWALGCILVVYLLALPLWKKKIYIKL